MSKLPKVAVLILNWNGKEDTIECLASLKKSSYKNFRIFVGDNGSCDNSCETISRLYPDVSVIRFEENFGFAQGNNLLAQEALKEDFDVLFLLNNDTEVDEDLLSQLVQTGQKLPKKSILGAKIGYYQQPDIIWDFGSFWDHKKGDFDSIYRGIPMNAHKDSLLEVDHIVGCAMWIPVEIVRELGLFDKRYFLYGEETDWCIRAKRAGVGLWSVGNAIVYHKVSQSIKGSMHRDYFKQRNRHLLLSKHFTWKERCKWFWCTRRARQFILRVFREPFRLFIFCILFFGARKKMAKYQLYQQACQIARIAGTFDHFFGNYGNCPNWIHQLARKTILWREIGEK